MTVGPTDTATLEPLPPPEPPAPATRRRPPGRWLRDNLFPTWHDALLSVAFAGLLGWLGYRAVRFVFVTGRWDIID
ncbi:MAG: hypothetical protein M3N52_05260, partial [Actinomycetota bacterium]|nr:hypothetical protein [Actinomycetota bacterium]